MTDKQRPKDPSWSRLILTIVGSLAGAAISAWAFVVVVSYILSTTPCQRVGTC